MIYFIFIVLIIYFAKNAYDINKFNDSSEILEIDELDNYKNKKIFNPILSSYKLDFDISQFISNNLYKHYITNKQLVRLYDFYNIDNIYIHKNSDLYNDTKIDTSNINELFFNNYSCNITKSLSIYKDNIKTDILTNKNNINLIILLNGEMIVNLYTPIHKDKLSSQNKNKYKIKITLTKNKNFLYIPTNWLYDIESNDISVYINITSDTIFTYHYNLLR